MKKRQATVIAGEKITPSDWVLLAIQTLATRKPAYFLTPSSKLDVMAGMNRRPQTLQEHPAWPLHKHPTPELCMTLSGAPILALQRHICTPGLAVIEHGVPHCEASMPGSAESALLWIAPAKSSLGMAVSKFDPRSKWNLVWRYSFHNESVIGFWKALNHLASGSGSLDSLSAELLLVFSTIHRDIATQAHATSEADQKTAMLMHVKDYLDANLEKPISLKQVAAMNRLTPNYLNSLFKQWQGQGIHAYLIEQRMENAMRLCRKSKMAIKEIAAAVGFTDALYFSKAFHEYHGVWPSELKNCRNI